MARTCGGVGALDAFDSLNQRLDFVGVGDVSGRLIAPDGTTRGLASHPGILGVRQPLLRVLPYRAERNLLVLHSDGVRDRWRLRDYPGSSNGTLHLSLRSCTRIFAVSRTTGPS